MGEAQGRSRKDEIDASQNSCCVAEWRSIMSGTLVITIAARIGLLKN